MEITDAFSSLEKISFKMWFTFIASSLLLISSIDSKGEFLQRYFYTLWLKIFDQVILLRIK